jgi:hypothetical protein
VYGRRHVAAARNVLLEGAGGGEVSDWQKFFSEHGDHGVRISFYEVSEHVTVETLYQAFAARFKAEQEAERQERFEKLRAQINGE